MKKLNITMGLVLIFLCVMLISADVTERPEQRFEYAKMTLSNNPGGSLLSITWQTENFGIYSKSMQDLLIRMSGESVAIGDIKQVKNEIGMINFLGDSGWELVSVYCLPSGFLGTSGTDYIFKRLWSK